MKRKYPYKHENSQEPEKKTLKMECSGNIFSCINHNVMLRKKLYSIKEDNEYDSDIESAEMDLECYDGFNRNDDEI